MDAKSGKKWQKLDKNMQIPTWELKKKAIEPALELNPLSNLTRTKKVQIYIEPAGSIRDFTVYSTYAFIFKNTFFYICVLYVNIFGNKFQNFTWLTKSD